MDRSAPADAWAPERSCYERRRNTRYSTTPVSHTCAPRSREWQSMCRPARWPSDVATAVLPLVPVVARTVGVPARTRREPLRCRPASPAAPARCPAAPVMIPQRERGDLRFAARRRERRRGPGRVRRRSPPRYRGPKGEDHDLPPDADARGASTALRVAAPLGAGDARSVCGVGSAYEWILLEGHADSQGITGGPTCAAVAVGE